MQTVLLYIQQESINIQYLRCIAGLFQPVLHRRVPGVADHITLFTAAKLKGMNSTTALRTASDSRSRSSRNLRATLSRLTSGQGWNQSITVLLMVARNRWLRTLNASPTGLAVKATCRLALTLLMKVLQQISGVSTRPSDLVSPRMALMISSRSSCRCTPVGQM